MSNNKEANAIQTLERVCENLSKKFDLVCAHVVVVYRDVDEDGDDGHVMISRGLGNHYTQMGAVQTSMDNLRGITE